MAKSGGGINSRVNVRPPMPKPGSNQAVSPAGAAQLGRALGNIQGGKRMPGEPLVQGKGLQSTLGNAKALDVGAGGPGAGRVTMRSGSQGTHGAVASTPPGTSKDTLAEYGPERGEAKR